MIFSSIGYPESRETTVPDPSAAWQAWLSENLQRGCSAESMCDTMVRAGIDAQHASSWLRRATHNLPASESVNVARPELSVDNYVYDDWPMPVGNQLDGGDRLTTVALRCERPQVLVLDSVLSELECDEIVARSQAKLRRSTTIDPLTGEEVVIQQRSSEGTFFALSEDTFIDRLDQRIARMMNWPIENGEGFQVLRYGVGGEYTPHFDYFPPADSGSAQHVQTGGQRVASMVIYLSHVEQGGSTIFPTAGLTVSPRKGGAVYFRYTNGLGQLDPLSLHGGAPVLAGNKWIMTKWMRQRRYG